MVGPVYWGEGFVVTLVDGDSAEGAGGLGGALVMSVLAGMNSGPFWPQPESEVIIAIEKQIAAVILVILGTLQADFTIRIIGLTNFRSVA